MASTTAWIGGNGAGLAWADAGFTAANFNSLASGSCALSAPIDNSTALDLYADLSFSLVVGAATTATSYMVAYLLPLNQDGTTYGDGATGGASVPSSQYEAAAVGVLPGVASGSKVTGTLRGIVLAPGKFILALANQTGAALGTSASAQVSYRSYNENLNR